VASFFTTQRDRQEELLDEYLVAVDTPDKLADRLEALTLFTRPPEGDFGGSQRVGGSTLDIEAIRVLKPGQYELDLVHLFKGEPLVYKLEEGKYVVDLIESLKILAAKKEGKKKVL